MLKREMGDWTVAVLEALSKGIDPDYIVKMGRKGIYGGTK